MRRALPLLLIPFALATIATTLCYFAAGANAGLFFGGVAFAAILAPPLSTLDRRAKFQSLSVVGIIIGTSAVWLTVCAMDAIIEIEQTLKCIAVLITFVIATWGLTHLLVIIRIHRTLAAAIVTAVALLWLTWPIWLSPYLAGKDDVVAWLTPAHPLLAIDQIISTNDNPWTQRPLMYNTLSILNQDVAYALPQTIWAAVALHGGVGMIALLVKYIFGYFRRKRGYN